VGGRTDAVEAKAELLSRLGLQTEAADQDIEAAHDGLVDFLETAPPEVKSWAAAQTADVDEAFALLSGPELNLAPETPLATTAQNPPGQNSATPLSPSPAAPARSPGNPRWTRWLAIAASLLVVVAVVFGVYSLGRTTDAPATSGTPTGQETTAAAAPAKKDPVDKAKVTALMKKISAHPKDIGSLQALGNLYFAAADYKNASTWEQKILGVDPVNQSALLALGAAQFNLGNAAEAKKQWLVAARLYPNIAEVHYDLGFLYMSQTPPDTARMTAEWNKVVAIDPTSDLAKTVKTHLKGATSSPARPLPPARLPPPAPNRPMTIVSIAVAFLAGFVSFASPCCLPLVPVYVTYMVGTTSPGSPTARRVAFRQALAFVLGFTVVFVALWASVGLVGYLLRDYVGILRQVGGSVLIVMGLHVAGVIRISALYRQVRVPTGRIVGMSDTGDGTVKVQAPSYVRSTLLGAAFAAGWTPCVGPILGGIIGLASLSSTLLEGTVLLFAYALGLGVPFVLVAVGASAANQRLAWFRRHEAGIALVTGGMLILVGFLMITNLFVRLSGVLPNFGI
jgi:cytochrome c-type biogenesis protein